MTNPRAGHTESEGRYPRRSLRPRQERSYAESPDVVLLSDEEPRMNGFTNGYDGEDSDDGELQPFPSPPIKVGLTIANISFLVTERKSNLKNV